MSMRSMRCVKCFSLMVVVLVGQGVTLGCSDSPDGETEATTGTQTTSSPTQTSQPTLNPSATEDPTTEDPTTEDPTTEGPTTEPTTEEPTTEEPTTDPSTTEEPTTSDTAGDCDLEADVLAVELNVGGPIFTATSESLVAVVEDQILELTLCGDVLNTVVSGIDLGYGEEHFVTPDNSRLYFTDDHGVSRVSFPSGDNFEELVEDSAIYELAVAPDETELYYYVNGGDAFHVILEPLGQPQLFDVDPTPRGFDISPDGSKLAYMDNSDDIYTLDIGSDMIEFQVHVGNGPRRVVQWMPDNERIMFLEDLGEFNHFLRTYNINTDETVDVLPIDEFPIGEFALAPDASRVVVDLGLTYNVYRL